MTGQAYAAGNESSDTQHGSAGGEGDLTFGEGCDAGDESGGGACHGGCRGAAPARAHPAVSARARYVTRASGGAGAGRELCDLLLQAQGRYADLLAPYLPGAKDPA